MARHAQRTHLLQTGVAIRLFDAVLDIRPGQTLGMVQQAGETTGLFSAIGDAEQIFDPLLDPGVGYKLSGLIAIETFALPPAAGAGDDINDVLGLNAGDLLLEVAGRN